MTSQRWPAGSSSKWRRIRTAVLIRDHHQCQLRLDGCTGRATQVHHTAPRETHGDDPRRLLAACAPCNTRIGDPTRTDPEPNPSRW